MALTTSPSAFGTRAHPAGSGGTRIGAVDGNPYMLKLLERNIASVEQRLLLLAPSQASVPAFLGHVEIDSRMHRERVRQMQGLRGGVYLNDGAVVPEQLSPEGLHQTPEDERSWHLLTLDKHDRVSACAWFLQHDQTVQADDLRVGHSPLAREAAWRGPLWGAVESEIESARRDRIGYVEVGGWAVAEDNRNSTDGLVLALAGYSLGRVCGGVLGLTTATIRHCSSTILRRLGGASLAFGDVTIPAYYDPKYRCEMELLRFDSRRPNPKYSGLIELLREKLADVQVIAPRAVARSSYAFAEEPEPSSPSLFACWAPA